VIEPYSIYAGVPAKFVKMADPEQTKNINKRISDNYQFYASWYQEKAEKRSLLDID
jgi:carbonic anhydrase/acetyltransferase-like protein (isoleucine patch superfamily)